MWKNLLPSCKRNLRGNKKKKKADPEISKLFYNFLTLAGSLFKYVVWVAAKKVLLPKA